MTVQLSCLLNTEIEEGNVCFGSIKMELIRLYVGGVDFVEDASICQLDSMCTGRVSCLLMLCLPFTDGKEHIIKWVVVFSLVKIRVQRACKLCPEAGHSLHRNERPGATTDLVDAW